MGNAAFAHKLVYQTAVEMGHELYDVVMQDNEWYEKWKSVNPGLDAKELEDKFVKRNLKVLLPQARSTLAQLLRVSKDEALKEEVYRALVLDKTLKYGRMN
jgi:hypothetical protein